MYVEEKKNATMTTVAMKNSIVQGDSDTQSIAIFVLPWSNKGGCVPLGTMQSSVPFTDGANPLAFPFSVSLQDLILRSLSTFGIGCSLETKTAGIVGLSDLMVGAKYAEGMAEAQLLAFSNYLKDTKNRADKTAQGLFL